MTRVELTVPGKLMLAGEYAVLSNAPALLACVDLSVHASLQSIDGPYSEVRMRADDEALAHFRMQGHHPKWTDSAAPSLIDALVREFPPTQPIRLAVDSSAFFSDQRKLGLGSSAAVAVAVGGLLQSALTPSALARIDAAHRDFQGGRGSGADIYAVATGGVTIYDRASGAMPAAWPDGLLAQPMLAPSSTSTVDRIARLDTWRGSDANADAALQQLADTVQTLVSRWQNADITGIMSGMADYLEQMSSLSAAAGLDYLGGGHERLVMLAREHHVVYKPCGAGGGDVGIAVSDDAEALADFAQAAVGFGFSAPNWAVGAATPRGDAVTGVQQ